jgi:hypothetical protein
MNTDELASLEIAVVKARVAENAAFDAENAASVRYRVARNAREEAMEALLHHVGERLETRARILSPDIFA